ncbi:GNAT family acetyltransferase [Marinomonas alcarazii]|uniref:GNAT family acetyltransferase n=1 Tax=Marinomonas alcarazii TaxID=491949 RepID=A0A318UXK3_9GAMM|nr:GNAT family N-acetyltransferase [Marinomonas alcarazii]PYF80533.1 GNAT family acetyltransferase [Marinomonas alcarazii]
MKIRHFKPSDSTEIADLFHGSVHSISSDIYSAAQLEAWAPTPPGYTMWKERLAITKPFVATIDDVVVGFIELESDGHIDCLYVHRNYQRRGVALALFKHASDEAIKNGCEIMYVEASILAKAFFEKMGFDVQAENIVQKNHQELINYSMIGAPKP